MQCNFLHDTGTLNQPAASIIGAEDIRGMTSWGCNLDIVMRILNLATCMTVGGQTAHPWVRRCLSINQPWYGPSQRMCAHCVPPTQGNTHRLNSQHEMERPWSAVRTDSPSFVLQLLRTNIWTAWRNVEKSIYRGLEQCISGEVKGNVGNFQTTSNCQEQLTRRGITVTVGRCLLRFEPRVTQSQWLMASTSWKGGALCLSVSQSVS